MELPFTIESVEEGSPAWKNGIAAGEKLLSINGNVITDVLDYRFYMTDTHLSVELCEQDGSKRTVR
ncbi:MAG: PDZ domain-containing protein, partial [Angelakisella sp.]